MSERFICKLRKALMIGSATAAAIMMVTCVILLAQQVYLICRQWPHMPDLSRLQVLGTGALSGMCPPIIVFMMALALNPVELAKIGKQCRGTDEHTSTQN